MTKIRIVDIAKKAGVSKGTVDRVLHERGNVSPKAKEKVMEAMKDLNYQPNLLASILAQNKQVRIAALFPDDIDPFWQQPKEGIRRALSVVKDFGIQVDFFFFNEKKPMDFTEKGTTILSNDYDGIIVVPMALNEAHHFLDKVQIKGIKYILINTFLDRTDDSFVCYIGQNSYSSGKLGAKLLNIALNDRDDAMILHLEKAVYNAQHLIDKEKGFKDFFQEKDDKAIKVISRGFEDVTDTENLFQFLKNTLQAHPNIKGIFVTTSRAYNIVPILEKLDRLDIRIVGFDLVEENLKYLKENKIAFLINQNPLKQGYLGVINFFRYFIKKEKISQLQYLPLDVVVDENAEFYLENEEEKVALVL